MPAGGDQGPRTKIVAIRPDQRRARRLSVSFANGRTLSVHKAAAKELSLVEGAAADPAGLARAAAAKEGQAAWEAGLQVLGRAARSRRDLRERLAKRGFLSDAIRVAMSRLVAGGYVDDERFARDWVDRRVRQRSCGRRALEFELRRKGVSREVAAAAVAERLDEDTELELAAQLARRRLERAGASDVRARRRVYGVLARRGFTTETIRAALARALPDAEFD